MIMMKSLKLVCIHVLLFSTSNSSSCVASSTSTSSNQFLSKSTSKLDTNLFSHRTNTNTIATRGGASTNQSTTTTTNKTLSSSEMAFAGAVATALGVVLMHPIDTIKTLQQSSEGIGLNMIGATNKILSRGGVPALYEGLGPYVTSDGLAGALKFATYETLKKWMQAHIPEEQQGSAIFVCAALAFMASSIVLVPGELLKQRLQMGQISSVRTGLPAILKQDGILGLYSGYSGVCMRDIPYTMLELGIYDNLKSFYLKIKAKALSSKVSSSSSTTTTPSTTTRKGTKGRNKTGSIPPPPPPSNTPTVKITQLDEIIAAAISGGITGFLTSPLDNIKTKLMVEKGYNGFFDCVSKSIQTNGFASLFNGSMARVAWLMPFTAFYLPVYELIKRRMLEARPTTVSASASSSKTMAGVVKRGGGGGVKKDGAVLHRRQGQGQIRPMAAFVNHHNHNHQGRNDTTSLKLKQNRYEQSVCF
jgi:solute carrier family 25 S-adenosylmethionine transporter 26